MKYMLSLMTFLLLLSGCSSTYRSLTDGFTDKVLSTRQEAATTNTEESQPAKPNSKRPIPTVESVQASYSETAHLDRM